MSMSTCVTLHSLHIIYKETKNQKILREISAETERAGQEGGGEAERKMEGESACL